MSNQSFLERLQWDNEKTMLIQGLPSSIEKQFAKLSFSKNVTPLLKRKKIDFALLFVINNNQLCTILKDVFPALHDNSKLWIAYPKTSSKIVSDLNRACTWDSICCKGYKIADEFDLDNVWMGALFLLPKDKTIVLNDVAVDEVEEEHDGRKFEKKLSVLPVELNSLFVKHKKAKEFFVSLPSRNQKEYVTWIQGAKRAETKERRLEAVLANLLAGKMNPSLD
ncbi:MAG: YdeI/OmpD-associated family protein [Chitinophagaceae bacterium]